MASGGGAGVGGGVDDLLRVLQRGALASVVGGSNAGGGVREEIENYMSARICPDCHGARLKPETLAVTVAGRNIVQVTNLSIVLAQRFFKELEAEGAPIRPTTSNGEGTIQPAPIGNVQDKKKHSNGNPVKSDPYARINPHEPLVLATLTEREQFIARQVLKEIRARLQFLVDVGLEYLTLDRAAASSCWR